jgi:cell division protein FtsB
MTPFTRSRARVVFFLCLLVAGYFTYTAVVGAIRNHQLAESQAEDMQALQQLEERRTYLEGVRDYVASDEYVEQQARRVLGYVREGEIPFVVTGPALPESEVGTGDWWERLFPR